jgi:hypothetical protein
MLYMLRIILGSIPAVSRVKVANLRRQKTYLGILLILPRQQPFHLLLLVRMVLCEILWRWLLVGMVLLMGIHASQWRSKMLRL